MRERERVRERGERGGIELAGINRRIDSDRYMLIYVHRCIYTYAQTLVDRSIDRY